MQNRQLQLALVLDYLTLSEKLDLKWCSAQLQKEVRIHRREVETFRLSREDRNIRSRREAAWDSGFDPSSSEESFPWSIDSDGHWHDRRADRLPWF